jgi:GT2 family glycosyltransferase
MVTPARPRVTVAVLNYNGRELLDVGIPSVLAQSCAGGVRVLVVDDGSSDGSVDHVRTCWPSVGVVEIGHNVGIAASFNRAVAAAAGSQFVALLNNDVELEPDWLAELVGALDAHPKAASATGKLLRFHDRSMIDAAGDLMLWSSAVINRGRGEPDTGQYDQAQTVFAATAGAALYRLSAFEAVGLFDESFFAYLEDIDWGARARLAGWECRYVPTAVGYHMGGATTGRRKGFFGRMQRRNQLLLTVKDFPADALLRHGWKIVINQLLSLAASARDGMLREQLRAWVEFALALPVALRERGAIQRSRVVGTRELDAAIQASLPPYRSRAQRLLYELAPLTASRRAGARV